MGFFDRLKKAAAAFAEKERKASNAYEGESQAKSLPSYRQIVFDVIIKNFYNKPFSIRDIELVLKGEGALNSDSIKKAIQGLYETEKISRVKRGTYILSNMQEKEKKHMTLSAHSRVVLNVKVPLTLINKMELLYGKRNRHEVISLYIKEQLTNKKNVSIIELDEENKAFLEKKQKCYFYIPRDIYEELKAYAATEDCSISTIARCFFARWCGEQEKNKKISLEQERQVGVTVARALRIKKHRDLGKFCQFVEVDSTKYKYWELGKGDHWVLNAMELARVAAGLHISVESIATSDGHPVFLN